VDSRTSKFKVCVLHGEINILLTICRSVGAPVRRPRGPLHLRKSRGATSMQGDVALHGAARQGAAGRHPRPLPLSGRDAYLRRLSPRGGGEKAYKRRLLSLAGKEGIVKEARSHTRESSKTNAWHALSAAGSPCPAPGTRMESTHRKPTAVGKEKTSLPASGEVKTDEAGRSRPISVACQSA
jgi:hypothetical protein